MEEIDLREAERINELLYNYSTILLLLFSNFDFIYSMKFNVKVISSRRMYL